MMKQDFHAIRKQRETALAEKADDLRAALRICDPNLIATRSGSSYQEMDSARGEFHIPFWGVDHIFPFPNLIVESLSTFQQTLLLYYLSTADGAPQTGKWVSFADLPDGRVYDAAFQGYTGDEISKNFSLDLDAFSGACIKAGGRRAESGDAAYLFQAFPRVSVMVNYWLGDEDFSSSCKILFDSAVSHYLPIEACAILGSSLTRKLISFQK